VAAHAIRSAGPSAGGGARDDDDDDDDDDALYRPLACRAFAEALERLVG
jgi:hypothetical protein